MKKGILYITAAMLFFSCKNTTKTSEEKKDVLPFFNSASFTPEWIDMNTKEYGKIHTIPDFSFTNQEGDNITKEFYKGKIYIVDFFFVSCPGICPKLT